MSRQATWTSVGIRGALQRAATLVRQTTVRQAWFDLGWMWLAGLAVLTAIDVVLGLPVWIRWLALIAIVGYPSATILRIRRRIAERAIPDERAARLVEESHPELDNALINAVQFERVVEGSPEVQAGLMRSEISRAEKAVEVTSIDDSVSLKGERHSRRMLFGAIGVWAAAMVFLPGVVFAVLPRLLAPWMDDVTPPFSLTKIDISPKGATVRYGSALVVRVNISGPVPETLVLSTRAGKGDWSDVPLESTEPGHYASTLSGLREDTWIVAKGGGTRSGRYLIKVALPPVAKALQANYTYPAYTGLKPATETVGDKGIHGFRNTKVLLTISANRELTGGEMAIDTETGTQRVTLLVDEKNPTSATASFPITASGEFHIALASADGQVNSDAARGKIVLEHDQRPNVWFDEPAPEVVVTPTMKVGLDVEADDDMGVTQIDLHRVINGIADDGAPLYKGPALKRAGTQLILDMADLGVRPGDEIDYYANAFDNDPGHPNYAQTDSYKIRVLSEEEYQKLLKQQREAEQLTREVKAIKDAIDSLAERQQDIADKMDKLQKAMEAKPNDPALKKQMSDLQQEQKKLQDEAKQLGNKLDAYAKSPSASQIEAALKQKVAEAAKAISETANGNMNTAQSGSPSQASEAAKRAAEELKKAAGGPAKSVSDAIKNIEEVAPLFQDVERFKQLLNRQGQLVLQAKQFEDNTPSDAASRAKMDNIAAEQEKIQQELKALQEDLRAHAAAAQKHFPKASASAIKIADEIASRQIPSLMGSAKDAFGEERGPDGYASAQRALEEMQAMVKKGGACQSNCQGELDIKLMESLGKSGLGQSLGECLNPGIGLGNGTGVGSGIGGMQSGGSSSFGNGSQMNSPVAYTMNMKSLMGRAGTKRSHSQNRMPGTPASLSSDRIEVLPGGEKQPPKALDAASKAYPAEYKKLIKDYFVSVSKEKKQ